MAVKREVKKKHGGSAKVQDALYRIAELASAANDMREFYAAIHAIVGELMYANNFYIALYDAAHNTLNFPYYVDEVDPDVPDPLVWQPIGTGEARGITAYVLRSGKTEHLSPKRYQKLVASGEIVLLGTPGTDWVGVPLKVDGDAIGVMVLQTYEAGQGYDDDDVDLLNFVGQHIASALSRARAIDETKRLLVETDQRAAELAIINSVQEGLAQQLDMQQMYELVGDKIHEIFDTQVVDVALYDVPNNRVSYPYTIERGIRFPDEGSEIGDLRRIVLETREPLLINDLEAWQASTGVATSVYMGEPAKSVLFAPLIVGDAVFGVISLQNLDRTDAFTESDARLLTTLTSSLSVALENARLLVETTQRAAELAIINSVQAGLAEQLDMQQMYELVGDKIREIFDAQIADIALFDLANDVVHFPYVVENGVRFPDLPRPITGTRKVVLDTRQPLVVDDLDAWQAETGAEIVILEGVRPRSVVLVPLIVGESVFGCISLQNIDRTSAFSECGCPTADDDRLEPVSGTRKRPPAGRDDPARGGAGDHQQRPGGPREPARHAADVRAGGRQDPRDLRCAGRGHRPLRRAQQQGQLPVFDRTGHPLPRRTGAYPRLPQAGPGTARGAPRRRRRRVRGTDGD